MFIINHVWSHPEKFKKGDIKELRFSKINIIRLIRSPNFKLGLFDFMYKVLFESRNGYKGDV